MIPIEQVDRAIKHLKTPLRRLGRNDCSLSDDFLCSLFIKDRILRGPCATCEYSSLKLHAREGRGTQVKIKCAVGYNPVAMMAGVKLGQEFNCPSWTPSISRIAVTEPIKVAS